MKPQRIRELMLENFGAVWSDEHDWVNVHDGRKTKVELLESLIARHIVDEEVLIQIDDEHAARVSTAEATAYVAPHVLTADIQIANLAFTRLFFIAANGVAAGWKNTQSRGGGHGA